MNRKTPPKASEVLATLSAGKESGWSARARQRQADSTWLRRSRRIALHVLTALEAKGIPQKQLAEAAGVTPQYISRLVSGKEGENLSLKTIAKLEAALDICLIDVRDYRPETATVEERPTRVSRRKTEKMEAILKEAPLPEKKPKTTTTKNSGGKGSGFAIAAKTH